MGYMNEQNQVIVPPNVIVPEVNNKEAYPHHIESISGSDEVWYEIPEIGVRMRLNKEFAEDLVYEYIPVDAQDMVNGLGAVDFSTKSLLAESHSASIGSDSDNSIGTLSKVSGEPEDAIQNDHFQSLLNSSYARYHIKRFQKFYLFFNRLQGVCVLDAAKIYVTFFIQPLRSETIG